MTRKIMSDKEQLNSYAPSIGVRLLCWFGIYFGAQLPLIFFAFAFWMFPMGLAAYLFSIFPRITVPNQFINVTACTLAYAFYLIHLTLSLTVRNKRTFIVLMIILIIAVCLTLFGCEDSMAGLGQIKG